MRFLEFLGKMKIIKFFLLCLIVLAFSVGYASQDGITVERIETKLTEDSNESKEKKKTDTKSDDKATIQKKQTSKSTKKSSSTKKVSNKNSSKKIAANTNKSKTKKKTSKKKKKSISTNPNKKPSEKKSNKNPEKKPVVSKPITQPQLTLERTIYAPGEKFKVNFKASSSYSVNAWVGMIPSSIPHGSAKENDKHDLDYQYIDNRIKGSFEFKAPDKTGKYDIRMHDDEFGKEVASITFSVQESNGELYLPKTTYKEGEVVKVKFTAPKTFDGSAWVGLVKSKVAHGDAALNDNHDLEFYYLEKRTSGDITFRVYLMEGEYDIRMFNAKGGKEVSSVSFKVKK